MDPSAMLQQALRSSGPEGQALLVAVARLLDTQGLTEISADVFLTLLARGNAPIADVFFARRSPQSFLATIQLTKPRIHQTLEILIAAHVSKLDPRIALACLGYLSLAYIHAGKNPMLPLPRVSDIQHIGKFLLSDLTAVKDLTAAILDEIDHSGYIAAITRTEARKILDHYHDPSKKLSDILPHQLMA